MVVVFVLLVCVAVRYGIMSNARADIVRCGRGTKERMIK